MNQTATPPRPAGTANAQLLAVYLKDTTERARWFRRLRDWRAFSHVVELKSGWLLAEAWIDGSRPQPQRGELRVLFNDPRVLLEAPDSVLSRLRRGDPLPDRDGADMSLAAFEPGAVQLIRAACGLPNLYTSSAPGLLAIATRLDWIGLVTPDAPPLDWLPVATLAAGFIAFPDQRTPLGGVRHVRRGTSLHLRVDAEATERDIWQLERLLAKAPSAEAPSVEASAVEELAEVVRSALDQTLRAGLSDSGPNLVFFSGGLDSAAVAASAHVQGRPLDALSIVPPEDAPEAVRERRFVRGLRHYFHAHHEVVLDRPRTLQAELNAPPSFFPLCHYWSQMHALGLRPKTVMGGWNADETLGVLRIAEWVRRCRPRELPRLLAHVWQPTHALRRWHHFRSAGSVRVLPLQLSRPLSALAGSEYLAFRSREASEPDLAPGADYVGALRYYDRAGIYAEECAAHGALALLPFHRRELIEVAARTDPARLFFRHRQKVPLRLAMRDRLPPLYLDRTDSGDYQPAQPLGRLSPDELATVTEEWGGQLDKLGRTSHSCRWSWEDEFELCLVRRVSQRHQVLLDDRKEIRRE